MLARNYLLFTLVLLAITAGLYALRSRQIDNIYVSADWNALLANPALAEGNYDALERYLHGDADAFSILDEDGRTRYRSAHAPDTALSAGELSCVAEYGGSSYLDSMEFHAEDGSTRYLVTRTTYADGLEARSEVMLLDAAYRVISGSLGDGRTAYTADEFHYLTGALPVSAELSRRTFTGRDGLQRTILFWSRKWDEADYLAKYQSSWKVWLLFIPLYIAATAIFILWLNRRIRRPLAKLNSAIVSQADGNPVRVGNCGGPQEIREIGDSFDRLSAQLAQSEAERQRLDEGRQTLIANISHDLKTPITALSGYADAICDGKIPPEDIEQYLQVIRKKAQALNRLINTFHEYSKVEHPEFTLHTQRTDLCECFRKYLAEKYDEIDLAGFSLQVDIPEHAIFGQLDELQFRRVLDNLLSNSLQHNRLGTILFFALSAAGQNAIIRIGDNGIGIPLAKADTIFEPFVMGSESRSGRGSGLGLAISRRIVEEHRGAIVLVPPSAGYSTEFIITLPISP